MWFFKSKNKKAPKSFDEALSSSENQAKELTVKNYHVAGTSFRLADIMVFAVDNPDYSESKKQLIEDGIINERIYQYEFYPIKTELIPEPDNPMDSNAVKVVVDSVHIGYIKSGSCQHVLKLLNDNRIEKIVCIISGGKYKYIDCREDDDGDEHYELIKDDVPFYAQLEITERK